MVSFFSFVADQIKMASSALHLISLVLLCLATLSVVAGDQSEASQAELDSDNAQLSASLSHILRRRSALLQAPPQYYTPRLANYLQEAPSKRDDGYWIWMPAHGYISMPRDESSIQSGNRNSMDNLLRYGRKWR